jgi:fused signal recognition particle receptor
MLGWFKKRKKKPAAEVKSQESNLDLQPAIDQREDSREPSLPEAQAPPVKAPEAPSPPAATVPELPPEEPVAPETKTSAATASPIGTRQSEPVEVKTGKATKKTLFARLTERLGKTRETFTYQMDALFLGKKEIDTDLLDDLEEILISADLGINTSMELIDDARRRVKRKELSDPESLKQTLKEKIRGFITANEQDATLVMPKTGPFVIMVIGVNGVGKTTTIGKIAYKFKRAGNSVMLVAGDTFRAAAVSQLKIWG